MTSTAAGSTVLASFAALLTAQTLPVDAFRIEGSGRRYEAAFAVDPSTGTPVLHGGRGSSSGITYETSVWSGTRWAAAAANCGGSGTPPNLCQQQLLVDGIRQRLILVGGAPSYTTYGTYTEPSIWQYRAGCWSGLGWSPINLPEPETTYAYDEIRDCIVAYRGTPWHAPTASETWEWNGMTWLQRSPNVSPPPRCFAAMVYDRARQRTVLFGGWTGPTSWTDTWEWDGTNWQQVITPSSPGPSGRGGLLYDPVQSRCLLVSGPIGDLWSYDGSNWTQLTFGSTPLGGSLVAFDASRQMVLAFGGVENNATWSGALFGWDGTTWRILAPSSAPSPGRGVTHLLRGTAMVVAAGTTMELWERGTNGWSCLPTNGSVPWRTNPAVAYDLARQRIVLFGGNSVGALDETWEWDGSGWTQAQPGLRPSPREGPAMAFDPVRNAVLLFGGTVNSAFLNDTWSWDGTS